MVDDYIRQYGFIAIFTGIAIAVPVGMLLMSWMAGFMGIRPRKPNPVKYETYECGMQTIGQRWNRFNFRYYLFALLFLIFDVEIVFLYPWAVRFRELPLFALIEMAVFIAILVVGWVYAWRKRALEWE